MNNRSFLKNNWDIIIVLIIYTIIALFSLQYFQYKISGDEISYINIAHAYSIGDWGNAINGYWSPLFSWLMVPFLSIFGFKPLYGVYVSKILCIIIGLFTIISIRRFSRTLQVDITVERAILFGSIPALVYFSLLYNTPDLLLVCILIFYLSIIFDLRYSNNLVNGVLCGIIGSLAYFTKSFAFPFFLFHFILFNTIFYFRSLKIDKGKVLKNLFLGLFIFFVMSGLWAATISEKYGELTISTAGAYNQALVGPEYKVNTMDYGVPPMFTMGLIKPPNKDATSIWYDVSYLKMDHSSPFDSKANFEYELKLIWSNIIYSLNIIKSFMPLAIILVIFMILLSVRTNIDKVSKDILKYLLVTMLIYVVGYCLVIPEWRYYWFIFILLMISGFFMVDRLYKNQFFNLNIRNILIVLLICSFVIQPALEAVTFADQTDNYYNLSNILRSDYGIHGNIASDEQPVQMPTVAYYLNAQYFETPKENDSKTELQQELDDNNITYYFVWNTKKILQLPNYREITNGKIAGLKIYERI